MSASVNKVVIIGNLGADPEIRYTAEQNPIATFSIATSESWKDKRTGDRIERTEWHRIVIFAKGLAEIAGEYLHKGSKVYLEGQLRTRKWQDNNGVDRYTTEVVMQGFNAKLVMLDNGNRNGGGNTARQEPSKAGESEGETAPAPAPGNDGYDDDIPF